MKANVYKCVWKCVSKALRLTLVQNRFVEFKKEFVEFEKKNYQLPLKGHPFGAAVCGSGPSLNLSLSKALFQGRKILSYNYRIFYAYDGAIRLG